MDETERKKNESGDMNSQNTTPNFISQLKPESHIINVVNQYQNPSDFTKNETKTKKINLFSILEFLIVFILYSLIFLKYGFNFFAELFDFIINFISMSISLNETSIYLISLILSVFLIIEFFILTFPLIKDKKEKASKFLGYFVILILVITIPSFLFNTNDRDLDAENNFATQNVKMRISGIIEKVSCSFNTNCIEKEINKNEAKETKNIKLDLEYIEKPTLTYTVKDLRGEKLSVNYLITSTEEVELINVSCYYERIDKEHLLSSYQASLNLSKSEKYPFEVFCENLDTLENQMKEGNLKKEFKILTQTNFKIKFKYGIDVPTVNYDLFVEEEKLKTDKIYSYSFLKTKLDEISKDSKEVRGSRLLDFDVSVLKLQLPLLLGDDKPRVISFPLIIKKTNDLRFGKFTSARIVNIEEPNTIKIDNKESYYEKINLDDEIYEKQIRFEEIEQNVNQIKKNPTVQELIFDVETNFIKTNVFKVKVVK